MTDRIAWFVIPTCDRVSELQRAIESYWKCVKAHGHSLKFFIADNSSKPDTQKANKAMLKALAASNGICIYYAGPDEKMDFCKSCDSRVPQSVVHFALFGEPSIGPAMGANRNAALVHTVGSMMLSADDDTVCNTSRMKGSKPDSILRYQSTHNATEILLFDNREAAIRAVESTEVDVIGEHESMLGRAFPTVKGAPRTILGRVIDSGLKSQHGYEAWGVIRVTSSGIIGDSGFGSARGLLLWNEPKTRENIFESIVHMQSVLDCREVVRQARRPTLAKSGECLATVMGFDNRRMLPPFFPTLRGEDNLFGSMLNCNDLHSLVAYLPFVTLHAPPMTRRNAHVTLNVINLCEVIGAFCTMWARACEYTDPENRLKSLGRYLVAIGSMPDDDFELAVTEVLEVRASHLIHYLEHLSRQCLSRPPEWTTLIQAQINLLRTRNSCAPIPLSSQGCETPAARLRHLINSYGALLTWWVPLRETAIELANAGTLVGKPVLDL